MILIITLNPIFQKIFYYKNIILNSVNRNGITHKQAGGKGINVSRQLKFLGIDSYNLFFSGGSNGKLLRELLKKEQLAFTSVSIANETREAAVIISANDQKIYSFFSTNPIISQSEIDEMKSTIKKMIPNSNIVVISGSAPSNYAEDIVYFTVSEANKQDKITICDYYGDNLEEIFNLAPTIVHNNFDEINKYLNINLKDESDILSLLNSINLKGIKRFYLTDGENPFYAQNFDYKYRIYPPKLKAIDSTGCGDAFVAGLIYCLKNNETFEYSLKYATALASINSTQFDVCNVTADKFQPLINQISIEPIGKKVKLIDDTPTSF